MNSPEKPSIYLSLKEIVDPGHTALVVWDTQEGLVDSIFNRKEFLASLKPFIDAARKNRIPVLYTKITFPPDGYESPWRTFMLMKRYGIDSIEKIPKFLTSEIQAEIGPVGDEPVIAKPTPSIFIGTNFEYMMRNRGINTILFTGIATEIGIDSSARDCSNRGFYTIVVQDCVSSSDKEMHVSSLKALQKICLVTPAADITAEWKS